MRWKKKRSADSLHSIYRLFILIIMIIINNTPISYWMEPASWYSSSICDRQKLSIVYCFSIIDWEHAWLFISWSYLPQYGYTCLLISVWKAWDVCLHIVCVCVCVCECECVCVCVCVCHTHTHAHTYHTHTTHIPHTHTHHTHTTHTHHTHTTHTYHAHTTHIPHT